LLLTLFLAGATLVAGCGQTADTPRNTATTELKPTPDPQSDPRVPRVEEKSAGLEPSRPVPGTEKSIPARWLPQSVPTMGGERMVDSKYRVPTEQGDIQVTISLVRGGAEANIDRWINQMETKPNEGPSRQTRTIAGVEAHLVDCTGTFSGHLMSSISSRDCRLIGIIVPRPPKDLSIKLVGPAKAVASYEKEFDEFLNSLDLESPMP
jgi:hypothetical protein